MTGGDDDDVLVRRGSPLHLLLLLLRQCGHTSKLMWFLSVFLKENLFLKTDFFSPSIYYRRCRCRCRCCLRERNVRDWPLYWKASHSFLLFYFTASKSVCKIELLHTTKPCIRGKCVVYLLLMLLSKVFIFIHWMKMKTRTHFLHRGDVCLCV